MFKVMSLMKRKDGMSHEDFSRWILEDHVVFARKLPGMRRYVSNVLATDTPDAPFDGVSEMYFDDEAGMNAAFATDEGKAAGGDAAAHCANRFRMMVHEKVQW